MRFNISWIILVLSGFFLTSCEINKNRMDFYVVLSSSNVSRFTQDLASLATKYGLTPKLGQATDDQGHTLHVVEAKDRWMRLWSQNLPLSGHENPDLCGKYTEAHPDAGQYIVTVTSRFPFVSETRIRTLTAQLKNELSEIGYDVREGSIICSPLINMK